MILKSQIEADVNRVFLVTDDFAVSLSHYPDGDKGGPSHTVTGILTIDEAQSGNNLGGSALDGDGLNPVSERGVTERQSAILELPASEEVTESRGRLPSSLFLINDEYWRAVRVVGRDLDLQSVLVVSVDKHVTRKAMRK